MKEFPFSAVVEQKTGCPSALVLYIDYKAAGNFSFRTLLERIEKALDQTDHASVSLPPYELNEDFIVGTLNWRSKEYDIYYEYALGYLKFDCSEPTSISELKAALANYF